MKFLKNKKVLAALIALGIAVATAAGLNVPTWVSGVVTTVVGSDQ